MPDPQTRTVYKKQFGIRTPGSPLKFGEAGLNMFVTGWA